MKTIDELFDEYEQKKRDEQAKDAKLREEGASHREKVLQALQSTVLPVLSEISEKIQKRGHKSEVRQRLGEHSTPSVELTLTTSPARLPSKLNYSQGSGANGRDIDVLQEITSDRSERSYKTTHHWAIADLNQEAIRTRSINFVEAVLKG